MIANGTTIRICGVDDFCADDWGMSEEEYETLLTYNTKIATIKYESCEGYYGIEFEDGFRIDAVSDYHFAII